MAQGIDQIKTVLMAVCEIVNVMDKILHKKGLLVLFQLSDEFMLLSGLDVDALKLEIADLDLAERAALRDAIKAKLVLINPDIEKKIESGVDLLDEGVEMTKHAVEFVKRVQALLA